MNLAILDLDRNQAEKSAEMLARVGHECHVFVHEDAFFDWLHAAQCDLLLLSIAAGEIRTANVLARLSGQSNLKMPVLLLVEQFGAEMVVALLGAGAGDYLLSPYRESELLVRVQVLLRQAWPDRTASDQLKVGQFLFDTQARRLSMAEHPVKLTQKEFELALLLFQHLGQPLSRPTILDAVWGAEAEADPSFRSVDTHIARVRRKLRLRAETGFRLISVYGYGYVLEQLA